MSDKSLRVGDSERDEVAAQLSEHFAAGRLDISEFNERTEQALSSRTRGELDLVLNDLPILPVTVRPSTTPASTPAVGQAQLSERAQWRRSITTWAVFAVFFVILWAATGGGYFWPVFPILGWGIGVTVSGVKAYSSPQAYALEHGRDESLPPSTGELGQGPPPGRNQH